MHGKLVLSPEYFNEAISHSVVTRSEWLARVERKRRKATEGGSECEGRRECAKEVNRAYI